MTVFRSETVAPQVRLSVMHDLDGCWYDFAAAYYRGCAQIAALEGDRFLYGTQPARHWEFYEDAGHDLLTFLANCDRLADLGLLWSQMIADGDVKVWQRIAARHEVHVKTDRSFGSHPLASQVGTRMSLHYHALRYDSLTFDRDKTAGPAVDIAIEDKLSNYDAIDATGVQVWLLDRPWNHDPTRERRRVYSLLEWERRVEALAVQKSREAVAAGG